MTPEERSQLIDQLDRSFTVMPTWVKAVEITTNGSGTLRMGVGMPVDVWMDKVLDDWGWWVRDRKGSGYRCCSAEGRYRPERVPGDDERSARRMVDEKQCVVVEKTICHPGFPKEARIILKGWYVRRDDPRHIVAKAGIPRSWFDDRLTWAVLVARNRFNAG